MNSKYPITDIEASLLNSIIERPEDDTVRLVYADWLEENGHEAHAIFIRGSIALAKMSTGSEDYFQIECQLHEVWKTHYRNWLDRLGISCDHFSSDPWIRGFESEYNYFSSDVFFSDQKNLFARMPVSSLGIYDDCGPPIDDHTIDRIAEIEDLSRIVELGIVSRTEGVRIGESALEKLLNSRYLRNLESLSLIDLGLGDSHAEFIASCENLVNLTKLELDLNLLSPQGALQIVNSNKLKNLTRLTFRECPNLSKYHDNPFAREIDDPIGRQTLRRVMESRFGTPDQYPKDDFYLT